MINDEFKNLKNKFSNMHGGDLEQLEVIFSKEKRLIVEAPAGYGKTATMVSRVAYLYSTGFIPNPKKILALTFSINAALKMKRDIANKLPNLININNNPINIKDKVFVTNYHGFCKSILNKYGCLLYPELFIDINSLFAISDEEIDSIPELKCLNVFENNFIKEIGNRIKTNKIPNLKEIEKYNHIIISKLLKLNMITHTSIILLVLELFEKKREIKSFYQKYYPLIIVDEFQDTNCMSWELLKHLINENSQIMLLGDPLQRIYGFIGAIPNIIDIAQHEFGMKKIVLKKNYRFESNSEMLKLDYNIRQNAISKFFPSELENASLKTFWANSQTEEAKKVIQEIVKLKENNSKNKIAILFRGRGENSAVFEKELENASIKYFYGMFKDDDKDYILFHNVCKKEFIRKFGKKASIGKRSLNVFVNEIKKEYTALNNKVINSLCILLDAFIRKINTDYAELSSEDKYLLIIETFENKQLKQAMEYVDADIVISTIHGSKGLEWSYVFVADFERWSIPQSHICYNCNNKFMEPKKNRCTLPEKESINMEDMLDELSIFYVAVTRAKFQVYVSASSKRANDKTGCLSCFANMKGINLINAEN